MAGKVVVIWTQFEKKVTERETCSILFKFRIRTWSFQIISSHFRFLCVGPRVTQLIRVILEPLVFSFESPSEILPQVVITLMCTASSSNNACVHRCPALCSSQIHVIWSQLQQQILFEDNSSSLLFSFSRSESQAQGCTC